MEEGGAAGGTAARRHCGTAAWRHAADRSGQALIGWDPFTSVQACLVVSLLKQTFSADLQYLNV